MKIPPRAEMPLRQFTCDGRSAEWMVRWCAAECGFRVRRRSIIAYMKNVVFVNAVTDYILALPVVKRGGAFPFPSTDLDELDGAAEWASRVKQHADVRGLAQLRAEALKLEAWARFFKLRVGAACGLLAADELASREKRLRDTLGDLGSPTPAPVPPPPMRPRLVR